MRAPEKKIHGEWTSDRQTNHKQTDGNVDSMTDLAQRAESVKNSMWLINIACIWIFV